MDKNTTDLTKSWYDPAWVPLLNQSNVLDYFMQHTNPFYDRTCNNEMLKMQRQSADQITSLKGFEYVLLLHQEPILYVIQKRRRVSPTHAVPLVDYYIIAGVIYQSPDLYSVINSRLLNTIHNLESAFSTARGFQSFTPSRGYSWDFKNSKYTETQKNKVMEEPSSVFQQQRVDLLLIELSKKFPPKQPHSGVAQVERPTQITEDIKQEIKLEPKVEKGDEKVKAPTPTTEVCKPPAEKKMKAGR